MNNPAEWTDILDLAQSRNRATPPSRVSCAVLGFFRDMGESGLTRAQVHAYACALHPTCHPTSIKRWVDDRMGTLCADGTLEIRAKKWFLAIDDGLPD